MLVHPKTIERDFAPPPAWRRMPKPVRVVIALTGGCAALALTAVWAVSVYIAIRPSL